MSYETYLGALHYCMAYHGGMWSREYRVMCRLLKVITPSSKDQYSEVLDEPGYERAKEVYDRLVASQVGCFE